MIVAIIFRLRQPSRSTETAIRTELTGKTLTRRDERGRVVKTNTLVEVREKTVAGEIEDVGGLGGLGR